MFLTRLSLANFRSLARLEMELPRRVILLTGDNAQGKTSILEAIYFLAAFTSFQTHADRQLVNFHEAKNSPAVARLKADYQRGKKKHHLEARIILEATGVLNGQRSRKEIFLDGVKKRASEVIGHFNAAIFAPQASQIIEGAPEERRRYLNLALAQTLPAYVRVLSEYNQALTQRNALLKILNERGGSANQLDVWDETLAAAGAQLIFWRAQAAQEIERLASRIHHELTRGAEVLRIAYDPAFDPLAPPNQLGLRLDTPVDRSALTVEEIRAGFSARLKRIRQEEIARGVTVVGPHRDELRFLINKADAREYGSRGQIRTALLALKLAEVEWMNERVGEYPVILLDEVMAELDSNRRADLMKYVLKAEQVLFAATDTRLFSAEFLERAEIWRVQGGAAERQ